jgi:hypothetical protein
MWGTTPPSGTQPSASPWGAGAGGRARGAVRQTRERGRVEDRVRLLVQLAEHLGQALVELLEHHRAQAGGEVVRAEQRDEGVHRHFRTQRIGAAPVDAQGARELPQPLVELGQRVQELVVEQLGDLLAGQVDLQLRLRHQGQRTLARLRLVRRLLPALELLLDGLAEAGGQFQRAMAQGHHRDPVLLHRDVVVPGQRGQAHLFLDPAPEPGQHAAQFGHRLVPEGFQDTRRGVLRTSAARRETCRNGTKCHFGGTMHLLGHHHSA